MTETTATRPPLTRTLGGFQVFAISFAFISVVVGVFATYGEMLQSSGPLGVWLWIVAGAGQTLVALVVAQFAARIALSGSSYQWASRLASPRVGWFFGWLSFWFLAIAVVAIANALASQAIMPLLGMGADEDVARWLTLVILLVQAILVIASTRLLGMVTSAAVGVELAIVAVLVVVLLVVAFATGTVQPQNLVARGVADADPQYFALGGGLMAGMLMGLTTLVGFDSAANLAEEARDPYRTVPRAIVGSVIAAAVAGFAFLLTLTVSIQDVEAVTNDPSPVAAIIRGQLGPVWEQLLLAGIAFSMFGAGTVVLAAAARQAFAMARDGRFPASRLIGRVDRRTRTPVFATLLIVAIGCVLMLALPGEALLQLIIGSTILPALIYGGVVVLYLVVRRRLERRTGGFSLGRAEVPVAVAALVWIVLALLALVTPGDALVPALIILGLVAAGGVYFVLLLRLRPGVMDEQPAADVEVSSADTP
ncbi:amino acid permease [Microbacterium sp. lyk4-40-TSB-66]|uniref:APC family permease n=1 Tax=Microbacterium sp. lyk4-40-TSB-66 TaxID=3040294 RepID=UPI002550785E|nr:amino acid permease [Microbacterium sp. lyk4-40-TSB-66]